MCVPPLREQVSFLDEAEASVVCTTNSSSINLLIPVCCSVKTANPRRLGVIDRHPHYITRRYAHFAASLLALHSGLDDLAVGIGGEEMLLNDLGTLRVEVRYKSCTSLHKQNQLALVCHLLCGNERQNESMYTVSISVSVRHKSVISVFSVETDFCHLLHVKNALLP